MGRPLEAVARATASTLSTAPRCNNRSVSRTAVLEHRRPHTSPYARPGLPSQPTRHSTQQATASTSRASSHKSPARSQSTGQTTRLVVRVPAARLEPCSSTQVASTCAFVVIKKFSEGREQRSTRTFRLLPLRVPRTGTTSRINVYYVVQL